jgi:hypothetical protein
VQEQAMSGGECVHMSISFFTDEDGYARAGTSGQEVFLFLLLLVPPAFNCPATVFLRQILNSLATVFTGRMEYNIL